MSIVVSSGRVSSGIILGLQDNYMYIRDGGVASWTTVLGNGSMTILGGGMANKTTVYDYGDVIVYSGGVANSTTVENNGYFMVYDGGSAQNTIICAGGVMGVSGMANSVSVHKGGELHICDGGIALNVSWTPFVGELKIDNGIITFASDYRGIYIGSGDTLRSVVAGTNGMTLSSGYSMFVMNGGVANSTIMTDTMTGDTTMTVFSGGTANDTNLSGWYNKMLVYSGATVNRTLLGKGPCGMAIYNGGVANSTIVNGTYNGGLTIYSGGVANSTTVSGEGQMDVYSGGTANETILNDHGWLSLSGGVANSTVAIGNDGHVRVFGGTVNHLTVNSGAGLYYYQEGNAYDVTISAGGKLNAFSWDKTYHWDVIENSPVTLIDNVVIANNAMSVYCDGIVSETAVYSGMVYVSSGGTANGTSIYEGKIYVNSGANANSTNLCGSHGNTGNSLYGYMYISNGGMANSTTVDSNGRLFISSGGVATEIRENGGYVYLANGATATFVSNCFSGLVLRYSSATLHSGTTANLTTVTENGNLHVSFGGVANLTTLNTSGYMHVSSGGIANSTTVNSCGSMFISSGGTANGTTVNRLGVMEVYEGGKYTGRLTIDANAMVHAYAGSIIDFNISNTPSNDEWLINNFSRIYGSPDFTITISTTQAIGTYGLANGVSNFNNTVTVFVDNGDKLGMVSVGCSFNVGQFKYQLIQNSGTLSFVITQPPYGVSKIGVDTTSPTNMEVVVSATFEDGAVLKQYSFDNATWLTYTGGISFDTNGVVYFRGIDAAGNVSEVTSYEVSNIYNIPHISVFDDLNGDGRADVVMSITEDGHGAEGATGAWLIHGDQSAAWGDLSQRNSGWEIFGMGETAADKGTADVYVKSADNVVGAWVTDVSGKVAGWTTVGEFDVSTQVLGLGDFDGDGQSDLLLRNTNGAVGCCLTNGTGWNYFQSLGDEWSIVGVGDLNGDGRDDVVLKHDAGFAGSWLTQADCTMAWADLDTLPEGFAIVGCGDFDGDGTSDVLLKTGTYYGAWLVKDGSVKSWMGLGDLGSVTVEQIGDFDADGIDDLRIRTAAGDLGAQLVKGADDLVWKYYGSVGQEWSTSLAAI